MELKCFQEITFPVYMQVSVHIFPFIWALAGIWCFVVNCLGSNNSSFEEFGDGIVLLIRQSLDQSHSGNRVLGKHAPQALFHMIPSGPRQRYLTCLDSVENIYRQHRGNSRHEFFCSVISLQMHEPGGPQTAQDW